MIDKNERPDPLAVSIPDAGRMIGVSRTEVYRLLGAGRIAAVKQGVRTLVLVDSLRAHLAALPAATIRNAA